MNESEQYRESDSCSSISNKLQKRIAFLDKTLLTEIGELNIFQTVPDHMDLDKKKTDREKIEVKAEPISDNEKKIPYI